MIDDPGAIVAMKRRELSKAIELLLGMVTGMISDQHLHDLEIAFLKNWLTSNPEVAESWPGCVIAGQIRLIMEDGVVTDAERAHLLETLSQLAVNDFANTGSAAAEVLRLPINDTVDVDMRERNVCLTGAFLFGTRNACERVTAASGARPVGSVTRSVAYLIVGTNVSPNWAQTSYGRKIQQAVEMQQSGHPICIISERRWMDVLTK